MKNIHCGYLGKRKQRYEMTVLEHYERTRCYWCFEWSLSSLETRSNHHTMNHTQCINPCMVEKKTLMFIIFFTSMLKRGGVGGFWFLSSNFKKETWCYAISWCAMFVLYTGSGEMLLLTTDSGMDWLSVVFFFCCLSHVMMLWHHGGTEDVTLSGVDEVAVTTTMDAVGCSYAENFLVNLNNKDK